MKALLLAVFFIPVLAFGQSYYVLKAKDDPEAKPGIPSEWPVKAAEVGSVKNPGAPWVVMTKAEIEALRSANVAAKEVVNQAQETEAATPKRDRDALIKQAKADLTTIVDSSGTLTAAQLSNSVRAMARILRALIDDLGY